MDRNVLFESLFVFGLSYRHAKLVGLGKARFVKTDL